MPQQESIPIAIPTPRGVHVQFPRTREPFLLHAGATNRGHPMRQQQDVAFAYLRERLRPGVLVVLLLLAMAYPFAASAEHGAVFVGLCALGGLLIARAPRWLCYAAMTAVLIVLVAQYVFVISNGPHDGQSDRDEAVELATQAFVAGDN